MVLSRITTWRQDILSSASHSDDQESRRRERRREAPKVALLDATLNPSFGGLSEPCRVPPQGQPEPFRFSARAQLEAPKVALADATLDPSVGGDSEPRRTHPERHSEPFWTSRGPRLKPRRAAGDPEQRHPHFRHSEHSGSISSAACLMSSMN